MVLEALINPFTAEKKPWEMIIIGFIYNTIAILLSLWVFPTHASLLMVFLTSIACIPLIHQTIKMEESYDLKVKKEVLLLKEHWRVLLFLMCMFLGVIISVVFWYLFLPYLSTIIPNLIPKTLHQNLFSIQHQTITSINQRVTGQIISSNLFFNILINNLKVLVFCLLFAFIYGFGAIFILTWNASIIGVAIGKALSSGFTTTFLRYFIHGPFEIAAYFVMGLAGGIISIAVIRHDFGTKKFTHVLSDSVDLIIISIILLVIAALIEVFITPILF